MKDKKSDFKAVEFMREQRDRLSKLYNKDKKAFFHELEQSTKDFLKMREKKALQTKV